MSLFADDTDLDRLMQEFAAANAAAPPSVSSSTAVTTPRLASATPQPFPTPQQQQQQQQPITSSSFPSSFADRHSANSTPWSPSSTTGGAAAAAGGVRQGRRGGPTTPTIAHATSHFVPPPALVPQQQQQPQPAVHQQPSNSSNRNPIVSWLDDNDDPSAAAVSAAAAAVQPSSAGVVPHFSSTASTTQRGAAAFVDAPDWLSDAPASSEANAPPSARSTAGDLSLPPSRPPTPPVDPNVVLRQQEMALLAEIAVAEEELRTTEHHYHTTELRCEQELLESETAKKVKELEGVQQREEMKRKQESMQEAHEKAVEQRALEYAQESEAAREEQRVLEADRLARIAELLEQNVATATALNAKLLLEQELLLRDQPYSNDGIHAALTLAAANTGTAAAAPEGSLERRLQAAVDIIKRFAATIRAKSTTVVGSSVRTATAEVSTAIWEKHKTRSSEQRGERRRRLIAHLEGSVESFTQFMASRGDKRQVELEAFRKSVLQSAVSARERSRALTVERQSLMAQQVHAVSLEGAQAIAKAVDVVHARWSAVTQSDDVIAAKQQRDLEERHHTAERVRTSLLTSEIEVLTERNKKVNAAIPVPRLEVPAMSELESAIQLISDRSLQQTIQLRTARDHPHAALQSLVSERQVVVDDLARHIVTEQAALLQDRERLSELRSRVTINYEDLAALVHDERLRLQMAESSREMRASAWEKEWLASWTDVPLAPQQDALVDVAQRLLAQAEAVKKSSKEQTESYRLQRAVMNSEEHHRAEALGSLLDKAHALFETLHSIRDEGEKLSHKHVDIRVEEAKLEMERCALRHDAGSFLEKGEALRQRGEALEKEEAKAKAERNRLRVEQEACQRQQEAMARQLRELSLLQSDVMAHATSSPAATAAAASDRTPMTRGKKGPSAEPQTVTKRISPFADIQQQFAARTLAF